MTTDLLVPAAQYLRMSTEHQRYSFDNQTTAIQKYAESHSFKIVITYSDAAKSGIDLRHRTGLRQLLKDVVSGMATYKAVLVYDVSRWGRFQDIDESAHYEFLCKSSGVPIHYCAEMFANDGTLPSLIMKALKRTMAGEYSRELGVKVLDGQKRLARLGFKQGGSPGYGLRRMLVSLDRHPKQQLEFGERKSIITDRVILIPGPPHEVQVVRDIYRMLISEELTVHAIARKLNHLGVDYANDYPWDHQSVRSILTHPKYAGIHVFGRTSSKLFTPTVQLPKSEWVLTPGAFEPIIDQPTFAEAQRILQGRTNNKSDGELLQSLRALLTSEGRLTLALIKNSANMPSPSTYRHRFGSLRRAYQLIGYDHASQFHRIDVRLRTHALREELLAQIAALFPQDVSIVRRSARWRSRLRLRSGLLVSVLITRRVHLWKDATRWRIYPVQNERNYVTLLARLAEGNSSFFDFHMFANIDRRKTFDIRLSDPWLNRGLRLNDLSAFSTTVARVRAEAKRSN